ncbi:MAG: hypothetical protein R3358_14350 [Woeseiaceae bacterium]|nr:hypothetical protein [Woeseiaceae bacterium]
MTDRSVIDVISATADREMPAPDCREVFFPYVRVDATCRAPAFTGTRDLQICCLVDAVNGLAATADAFETEALRVDPQSVVAACTDIEQARRAAQRYLFHHLGRRARAIRDFGIEVTAARLVYKRFLVAQSNAGGVLIDSTTGGTYALPRRCDQPSAGQVSDMR